MVPYRPDPETLPLEQLAGWIGEKRLLPGRKALGERFTERIGRLEQQGVRSAADLLGRLSNKEKLRLCSRQSGIPEQFLTLLKREVQSYLPRPVPLDKLAGIPLEFIRSLQSQGIRNTRQFYDSLEEREELSERTGIPLNRMEQIAALCDLVRITGVGGSFARIVYDCGIRSVKAFAGTAPAAHERLYREAWKRYDLPGNPPGAEDIGYALHYARCLTALNR